MKHPVTTTASALAAVLALATLGTVHAAAPAVEKCAGVAKAGKNDCGTSVSACAGTSKVDGDKHAWVAVPKGTCEKIVGGVITTDPNAKPGGAGKKS